MSQRRSSVSHRRPSLGQRRSSLGLTGLRRLSKQDDEYSHIPLSESVELQTPEIVSEAALSTSECTSRVQPPDKGWAWIVLFGYSVITMFVPLIGAFFGLLFEHLVERYHMSSVMVAWIFNLHLVSWNIGGLFGGPLCKEFSWRTVALFGSIVSTLSMTLTSFINVPWFLFINSIIFGFHSGLIYCVGQMMLPRYFEKRLGLAMAICTSATGFGQFILPLYIQFLQEHYGFVWATRIFAVTLGNCIVVSMLFHPVEWHVPKGPLPHYSLKNCEDNTIKSSSAPRILENVGLSLKKAFTGLVTIDIFIISLCGAMFMVCYLNFMVMLPFSIMDKGFSMETAAYSLSLGGIANIGARALVGPLTDFLKTQRTPIFMMGHFLIGISIIAFVCSSSIYTMVLSLAVNGFATGTSISVHMLVLIELKGVDNISQLYGSFSILSLTLFISVGPLIGLVRDTWGSYSISNIILAGLVFFDVILLTLLRCLRSPKVKVDSNSLHN